MGLPKVGAPQGGGDQGGEGRGAEGAVAARPPAAGAAAPAAAKARRSRRCESCRPCCRREGRRTGREEEVIQSGVDHRVSGFGYRNRVAVFTRNPNSLYPAPESRDLDHARSLRLHLRPRQRHRCLGHPQGLRPGGEDEGPDQPLDRPARFRRARVAKDAAIDAIRAGQNRYTQTQGIAPLRTKLRDDLSSEIGRDVGEVLITSGVSGGLVAGDLRLINPGDEAIFLDPYFVMYKHLMTMAGGKRVAVDSYPDFRFHADRVERAITPQDEAADPQFAEQSDRRGDERAGDRGGRRDREEARSADDLRRDLRAVFVRRGRDAEAALLARRLVRHDHRPARLFQEPRDDRLATGLRRRARRRSSRR